MAQYEGPLAGPQTGNAIIMITGGSNIFTLNGQGESPRVDVGNHGNELAFVFGQDLIPNGAPASAHNTDAFRRAVAQEIAHQLGHCFGLYDVLTSPVDGVTQHDIMGSPSYGNAGVFPDIPIQDVRGIHRNRPMPLSHSGSTLRWQKALVVAYDANMTPQTTDPDLSLTDIDPSQPQVVSVAGHELRIYAESRPLIEAMVEDIRAARTRVWVESYIFLDDRAGQAVADALMERARAGLDVRVMADAIGSQTTPWPFFRELEEAGALVHIFHSFWEALWSLSAFRILNRRNHRKLVVIDETVAYFGGMNLADPVHVSDFDAADRAPVSAGWRDVHIRLAGPQQAEVAESFERSWRLAHGEEIKRRSRAYRKGLLAHGEESIQFFDSGPGLKHTRAGRIFSRALKNAKHTLTLSMAYFLPVGRVLRALLRAHRRGVFVRVVVPGQSDVQIVQHASRWLYTRLIRRRFHIYERQLNMLHSKVMIIDDQWSIIGSCNFDARSLWINLEFLAVIHSRKFAQALNVIVAHEIERSQRITLKECRGRSWWQRLIDRAAWAFRWWL